MWTIKVLLGDLGAASIHAELPYMGDKTEYTGSYRECRNMAAFIRWECNTVNGYNTIGVSRDSSTGTITYYIRAHFGMPQTALLTITKQ